MSKRNYYIDCLKGFGLLLVVIGHVFDGYIRSGMFADSYSTMCVIYNIIYAFHMPLFFIISGYVFRMAYFKDGRVKPSLNIQIKNTIAIYIIFSVLFGLFKIVCGKYTNSDLSFKDLLMIWLKPIAPYWYLYVLVFYYVFFSRKTVMKCPQNIMLAVLVAISCVCGFIPKEYYSYFSIQHLLFSMAFFFIGIVIYDNKNKIMTNPGFIISAFALSVILMIAFRRDVFVQSGKYEYNKIPVFNFFIAFGISIIIFYLFKTFFSDESKIRVKFFSFLGRYSLEVYVIHCVFTSGNRVVLSKLHIDNLWISVALNTVISVALPILFSMMLKKINMHQPVFKPVTYVKNKLSLQKDSI